MRNVQALGNQRFRYKDKVFACLHIGQYYWNMRIIEWRKPQEHAKITTAGKAIGNLLCLQGDYTISQNLHISPISTIFYINFLQYSQFE